MFISTFLVQVRHKLRLTYKSFLGGLKKLSLTYRLLLGLTVVGILIEACLLIISDRVTPAALVASTTKHATVNHVTSATTVPVTTTPPSPTASVDDAATAADSKPTKTTPVASPTPIHAGKLTLSTNSITVGPGMPGSVTITPSAGSMFYSISTQPIINVSCDFSVLNNVTSPFTIHYSFPSNPIDSPIPGTYNLTILAQDQTKAIQYYHLQVTVLPPTADQNL